MGDPKKQRKKYSKPLHPWIRGRIDEEKELAKEYGFRNKKETWKFKFKVRRINAQARKLIRQRNAQSAVEEKQLLDKLYKIGVVEKDTKLEDVLGLDVKRLLDRRLQSVVYNKKLGNSMLQARQLILHGHISVNGKKVTIPSYIVLRDEENKISYCGDSSFLDPDHPERKIMLAEKKKEGTEKIEKYVTPVNEKEFKESEAKAQTIIKNMQDKLMENKDEEE